MSAGGRMADRVAIVTGSTSGIGQRLAERFAIEGARVVVTGRRESLGHAVADGINLAGGLAMYVGADLTDPSQAEELVRSTTERWGRVDTLVNNAGDPGAVRVTDGPLHTTDPRVWQTTFEASLVTTLSVTRAALQSLASTGRGRIVNISSNFAVRGGGYDVYSMMKSAMVGLTRSMAVSYASAGVRVNCLTVGYVIVDRSAELWEDPAMMEHWREVGLTRPGRPDDVANACLWLGSDEAEYVTGAVIPVDGGMEANGRPGSASLPPAC